MSSFKRQSHTADFYLKVVSKAKILGNRKAVRQLVWMKKAIRLLKRPMRYRNPFWPELEENLCRWVKAQREAGNSESTITIRLKTQTIASERELLISKEAVTSVTFTVLCDNFFFVYE